MFRRSFHCYSSYVLYRIKLLYALIEAQFELLM